MPKDTSFFGPQATAVKRFPRSYPRYTVPSRVGRQRSTGNTKAAVLLMRVLRSLQNTSPGAFS